MTEGTQTEATTESLTERRRRWIREHYELRTIVDASQVRGYEALAFASDGKTVVGRIHGASRDEVCREARGRWGHFNYQSEAEEFGRIFPGDAA